MKRNPSILLSKFDILSSCSQSGRGGSLPLASFFFFFGRYLNWGLGLKQYFEESVQLLQQCNRKQKTGTVFVLFTFDCFYQRILFDTNSTDFFLFVFRTYEYYQNKCCFDYSSASSWPWRISRVSNVFLLENFAECRIYDLFSKAFSIYYYPKSTSMQNLAAHICSSNRWLWNNSIWDKNPIGIRIFTLAWS